VIDGAASWCASFDADFDYPKKSERPTGLIITLVWYEICPLLENDRLLLVAVGTPVA
jgi:hypothetical protein